MSLIATVGVACPPFCLGGMSYYGAQWPFNDAMQGCSGTGSEYPPQAGEDANGFPVQITPSSDQCANSATTNWLGQSCSGLYWVAGERVQRAGLLVAHCCKGTALFCLQLLNLVTLCLCVVRTCITTTLAVCLHTAGRYHLLGPTNNKPIGTYTAIVQGLGTFSMQYDAPLGTVTLPNAQTRFAGGTYTTFVDVPVTGKDGDVMFLFNGQNTTSPITSFKLYPPGCCDSAARSCRSNCTATYSSSWLKTLSGFAGARMMDWGATNGANLAEFADRSTPASISQSRRINRVTQIASVACYNPASPPPFFQGQPLALVTTASPHNLTTGQLVDIFGTTGGYSDQGAATLSSFNMQDAMVFVIDPTSFAYSLASWRGTPQVTSCTAGGAAGWTRLSISPGVAYEHMVELSQLLSMDLWVNVPHLAGDGFVTSMAEWWATNLPAGRKLYVELSNEVMSGC